MDISKEVDKIFDTLIEIRRDLHMHPELSECEYKTMDKICSYLDLWNIKYQKGIAGTGVVGIIEGKNTTADSKTVAIRADIDALPIEETTKLPYSSLNKGISHCCGHDGHTAILLGIAKIIKDMEIELKGNVKLIFQPAEETIGGAERMINENCLENPYVDYVLGLHMYPGYDTEKIGIKYDKMMAASDEFKVSITGKSCHGAHPDLGVDPIVIASQIILSLQTIVSRNISPTDSAVCSIGYINGGSAGNAITDNVVFGGILRTLDPKTRNFVKEKVSSICKLTAQALGGSADVSFRTSYSALINNDFVTDTVKQNAIELLGKENIITEKYPDMGTEDFSYFAEQRPSCYFHLGCGNKEKNITADIHNSNFNIDENCLKIGVLLQVKNILSLLK